MYFQRFSPAPPSALPTSAVGNLPVQSLPVPPPGIPYVQQPQFVGQPPELCQAAAIGAAYPAGPVQPTGGPYAPPVQLVAGTIPQAPSEPATGAADVDVAVPEPPPLASPSDDVVELPAEPVAAAEAVGPDFGAPRRAGRRRRRRGVPPDANAGDWVFCLSMTLLFLLTILGALAYFSVKKLLALKRRGPHH